MVIVDAGFWIELINKRDDFHRQATQQLTNLSSQNETLITTCAVMAETSHLLLNRVGQHAQQIFIEQYRQQTFELFELHAEHAPKVAELMEKYSDLPMDLADASLVILAEHLGHGRILSTDERDFQTYRWKNHEPFYNLLGTH
jgi:predicted nucleic acid-binding protein